MENRTDWSLWIDFGVGSYIKNFDVPKKFFCKPKENKFYPVLHHSNLIHRTHRFNEIGVVRESAGSVCFQFELCFRVIQIFRVLLSDLYVLYIHTYLTFCFKDRHSIK